MARKMVVRGCFAFPAGAVSSAMEMPWLERTHGGAEEWTRMRVARGGGVRCWCSLLQR
ncbi:hypothetical protein DEO72_LG8g2246 [Vigna unguiculata]|uniref:Uncharacterized protein n=1 Tax=Vigna unguiculata TaxID=3917 RepID=A0A4D6MS59_VIGUN|nr:hypothetical protein DEO72_LG8g2246 [Vigna unguiculata]